MIIKGYYFLCVNVLDPTKASIEFRNVKSSHRDSFETVSALDQKLHKLFEIINRKIDALNSKPEGFRFLNLLNHLSLERAHMRTARAFHYFVDSPFTILTPNIWPAAPVGGD